MIERYSRPEIYNLWSLESKFNTWLEIEIYACEAQAELGAIPQDAVKDILGKKKKGGK